MISPAMKLAGAIITALAALSNAHEHQQRDNSPAPVYAPLPPGAVSPALPAAGYITYPLGGGAYMVTDNVYQALFLVSSQGVILVDAPPSIGERLLYAIGNITSLPVRKFIYSHSHADHVEGASIFQSSETEYIGHRETAGFLMAEGDINRPVPTNTFSGTRTIRLGNQTLELSYKGLNHHPGNIFIYAPAQKVLMLVDVIFPGWAPFIELAFASNFRGYLEAHDQVLSYDFTAFVGGHLSRVGVREDVLRQREYVQDLLQECKRVINGNTTVDVLGIVGQVTAANPGNAWATFKTYYDTAAEACAKPTIAKYLKVLGGVDVTGISNALRTITALRIDYGVLGPFGVVRN
ncbi:MAG: hypothetical protein M1829_004461 [Trizodia sp. TS-e1964]|nr:MAG: hypothetical protein M1829_004461 [Trizodia sp. TS-e1964]